MVYLAVTPIHILRDGLADYRGDVEGPVPAPYAGKPFDDPIVVDAFGAYVDRMLDEFEPDRLAIGIEVDLLRNKRPDLWDGYAALHRTVYERVKAKRPDLPVFMTLTVHELLEPDGRDVDGILSAVKGLMPWSDRVALSYYPFLSGEPKAITKRLRRIRTEFAPFGKRFAIAECGQNAEPVDLPGTDIKGSRRGQAKALRKLLKFAAKNDLDFVIWFVSRDYDALWEKMSDAFPEWAVAWRDCGLADGDGRERPALRLWRKRLRRPAR